MLSHCYTILLQELAYLFNGHSVSANLVFFPRKNTDYAKNQHFSYQFGHLSQKDDQIRSIAHHQTHCYPNYPKTAQK